MLVVRDLARSSLVVLMAAGAVAFLTVTGGPEEKTGAGTATAGQHPAG